CAVKQLPTAERGDGSRVRLNVGQGANVVDVGGKTKLGGGYDVGHEADGARGVLVKDLEQEKLGGLERLLAHAESDGLAGDADADVRRRQVETLAKLG
ncbi:hypothetical protein K0B41_23955, partial [Salmonella enterica subsp. enterica serovar Mbandaka]|nr:hypothetical protein [Salmonella enterica subsp. enterica serovar Mbandaka]